MKQTAVEWLISQQKHNSMFDIETIEQAKEMEKQKIIDACIFFHLHYGGGMVMPSEEEFQELSEQYYNETFKNK